MKVKVGDVVMVQGSDWSTAYGYVGKVGRVINPSVDTRPDELLVLFDDCGATPIARNLLRRLILTPSLPEKDKKRHPNSQRFHELLAELGELHDRKQQDYGRGDDPFANVRSSTEWGVPAWVGAMVRANDKVRRLQSLIQNGKLENESAEDSLRDLAVYSIIALVLYEQEQEAA